MLQLHELNGKVNTIILHTRVFLRPNDQISDLKETTLATLPISVYGTGCIVPSQISSVSDTRGVSGPAEMRYSPLQPLPLLHLPPAPFTATPSSLETSSPGCSAGWPVAFHHYWVSENNLPGGS